MANVQQYLRPDVIRQVSRLDLRAKFIVQGFLAGLHVSPFHGFSVEFSEHRKYEPGDDVKDIDWNVYARTERLYVKKFQAETNLTCYLAMDLSKSMDYTYRQSLTKFGYAINLAAAMSYLMIQQQDPTGLVTFDTEIRAFLPPKSKRTQIGAILSVLDAARPQGQTDVAHCLHQIARIIRKRSLVILFSDLLTDVAPVIHALHHLRHDGNEVIIFQVLDEAEVTFPFRNVVELEDTETLERLTLDARGVRDGYLQALAEFTQQLDRECLKANIDIIRVHTGQNFDRALIQYLTERQKRF
ncbi:MAG: DUF58 domain-containing protein [Gemmatales bacterium]|nr:DUF58 domain-containing protein [Gemmatales bacterium]MDW8175206.1 DUF58 domain-containing protein [Gemmatales bacterium]MDW8222984.1 DUF58 domain-containing protein [Gemmatales bacterium]